MGPPGGSSPRERAGKPSEAELLAARRIVSNAEQQALDDADELCREARRLLASATADAARRRLEADQLLAEAQAEAHRMLAEAEQLLDEADRAAGRGRGGPPPDPAVEALPTAGPAGRRRRQAALAAAEPGVDDVVVLLGLLRDDLSAEGRVAAVEALARASTTVQLEALAAALADPDPGVRGGGLERLPVASSSRAAMLVLAGAEDEDGGVRASAYRRLAAGSSWVWWVALGRCSRRDELLVVLAEEDAEGLAGLVTERMCSPEVGDRVLAVKVAGSLRSYALLGDVVGALGDGEAVVRRAAAGQLRGWDEAVRGLVVALGDDPDVGVRRAAGRALADAGDDVVLLAFVERLADPDREVREVAVEALVRHRSAELAARLAGMLTAANVDSVGAALVGMDAEGAEALAAVVADGPEDRAEVAARLLAEAEAAKPGTAPRP